MNKIILSLLAIGISLNCFSQTKGWHLIDKSTDGVFGISLDQAYTLLKDKPSNTVIVAVIDSGIDTLHEDLKEVLWRNPGEIPGNGTDDDKNGYTDDVHGWNFIGGRDGRNVSNDSYEMARVYHRYREQFSGIRNSGQLKKNQRAVYTMWKRAELEINKPAANQVDLPQLQKAYALALYNDSILRQDMGKEKYTGYDLEGFTGSNETTTSARDQFLGLLKRNNMVSAGNQPFLQGFGGYVDQQLAQAAIAMQAPEPYRAEIVQDDYSDIRDRYYGNPDIMSGTAFHGTHVSGIIAAVRDNNKGIDGVAANVRIMSLRTVPDGDEHDKDVALAIRYAVDNGAQIINMSFGKGYSPEKHWVDKAVKYARRKGVLLVHAAGNDAKNIDSSWNYPTPKLKKNKIASNWITVGASGDRDATVLAGFSNYGNQMVDVFAPGVKIYSTVPGTNTYGDAQGTSMAAPVVTGLAALLLSYYPELNAKELKYIIETSAVRHAGLIGKCKTAGIINAYEAVKLADAMDEK